MTIFIRDIVLMGKILTLSSQYAIKKGWRDVRVVEGGGLENRCPERDRGFESYSLRQKI